MQNSLHVSVLIDFSKHIFWN